MSKCANCGAALRENAKFCMKCGSSIDSANAQPSNYEKANVELPKTSDTSSKKKAAKTAAPSSAPTAQNTTSDSKKFSKRKKIIIIASSVIGALLLVTLIAVLSAPKGKTDIGEGYEISGQRIAFTQGVYVIKGVAKNTTDHADAFTMTWKVFDKDEQEIGQAQITTGLIKSGESQEFQAQITSTQNMFDMIFNSGQQAQTGGPDTFELTEVKLYSKQLEEQQSDPFGGLFNFNPFF